MEIKKWIQMKLEKMKIYKEKRKSIWIHHHPN